MKVIVDKFASATVRLRLANPLTVRHHRYPRVGDVVVVRALTENPAYPLIELVDGRRVEVRAGEVIAGVIGSRQALRGFVGRAPTEVEVGEELHLLNMGGIVGRYVDGAPDVGLPVRVRVLGLATCHGRVVNIRSRAIPTARDYLGGPPVVLVIGTCMNVGKTQAATALVRELTASGLRVAAAKLSGVAALRDGRAMSEAGAIAVLSFLDAGYPSTVDAEDIGLMTRSILNELGASAPDVIIAELGDGIMGRYRVLDVLSEESIMEHVRALVVCASDIMAAFGAHTCLGQFGLQATLFSGPCTDNSAGASFIIEQLGVPALNAVKEPKAVSTMVLQAVRKEPSEECSEVAECPTCH